MDKIFIRFWAAFMSCIIMTTALCISRPEKVDAAPYQMGETLVESQEVEIQLDGQGAKESIRYEWSDRSFYYYLDLYIDDEKVASFKNSAPDVLLGDVFVTDIDTTDKVKDIFVLTYGSGNWPEITTFYYCRYENGKFKQVQDLKKYLKKELKSMPKIKEIGCNFHKMQTIEQLITVMGSSMMGITTCGNSKQIGYFHAQLMLKLDNKKIKLATKNPYGCVMESCAAEYKEVEKGNLPYYELVSFAKLKSNCKFYTEPNGKKTAFTAKKGTSFKNLYFQLIGGKLYIGTDNSKGKTGWIKDSQKAVFKTQQGVHIFN